MATSTFDKEFIVTNPESQKRLRAILESDEPGVPLTMPLYDEAERKRSEELFKYYLSRSRP